MITVIIYLFLLWFVGMLQSCSGGCARHDPAPGSEIRLYFRDIIDLHWQINYASCSSFSYTSDFRTGRKESSLHWWRRWSRNDNKANFVGKMYQSWSGMQIEFWLWEWFESKWSVTKSESYTSFCFCRRALLQITFFAPGKHKPFLLKMPRSTCKSGMAMIPKPAWICPASLI